MSTQTDIPPTRPTFQMSRIHEIQPTQNQQILSYDNLIQQSIHAQRIEEFQKESNAKDKKYDDLRRYNDSLLVKISKQNKASDIDKKIIEELNQPYTYSQTKEKFEKQFAEQEMNSNPLINISIQSQNIQQLHGLSSESDDDESTTGRRKSSDQCDLGSSFLNFVFKEFSSLEDFVNKK